MVRSPGFGSNRSNWPITMSIQILYITVMKYKLQIYALVFLNYSPVAFARALNLATPINLLTHYAKGTPSFINLLWFKVEFRLLIELLIQDLFHRFIYKILIFFNTKYFKKSLFCIPLAFQTFPLQYLFTIAKFIILSLRGWYPYIPTSFLSSYFI